MKEPIMQPLKIKVEISNDPHIALPEILLNLLNLKSGDDVYIPLDSMSKERGIEEKQINESIIEQSTNPIIEKRQIMEPEVIYKRLFEESIKTNPIFKKTYDKLTEFAIDKRAYPKNPQKSMIAFYTSNGGLCWLEYKSPGAIPFPVHLAKGNYIDVDSQKKVIYNSETKKTWGGYPIFRVEKESDVEYLANLVKFALNNNY